MLGAVFCGATELEICLCSIRIEFLRCCKDLFGLKCPVLEANITEIILGIRIFFQSVVGCLSPWLVPACNQSRPVI